MVAHSNIQPLNKNPISLDFNMSNKTHFGFQEVDWQDKAKKVESVFSSVAKNYDIMNDAMSFGLHRLWKKHFVQRVNVCANAAILDLAGGTGDISIAMLKKLNKTGRVILSDINYEMLTQGRIQIQDKTFYPNLHFAQINAEALPFANNSFDRVTISFGLRNVTDKPKALAEMQRILKPGGKCCILEFSKPITELLKKGYDFYSFRIIPRLGELIAKDKASYEYLVESIRMHPDQETLKNMLLEANFDEANFENLSGGIVAIHQGYKY